MTTQGQLRARADPVVFVHPSSPVMPLKNLPDPHNQEIEWPQYNTNIAHLCVPASTRLFSLSMDEIIVREKLRAFITRDLVMDDTYPLVDGEGIISGGLMDSFALAELAVFVEREFAVYIPDPDLTVEKMNSLNQIVARVLRG